MAQTQALLINGEARLTTGQTFPNLLGEDTYQFLKQRLGDERRARFTLAYAQAARRAIERQYSLICKEILIHGQYFLSLSALPSPTVERQGWWGRFLDFAVAHELSRDHLIQCFHSPAIADHIRALGAELLQKDLQQRLSTPLQVTPHLDQHDVSGFGFIIEGLLLTFLPGTTNSSSFVAAK